MVIRTLLRRIYRRAKPSRKARFDLRVSPIPDQEPLGTSYGGWTVPVRLLDEKSICYCFGAGEDISFDVELIRCFGCQVHTFDPTPRSIEHVNLLFKNTHEDRTTPINNDADMVYDVTSETLKKLHFHDYGIWSENTTVKFYAPQNQAHVSHSILNLQHTSEFFEAQCYTLKHVMTLLGHSHLDLLKLDIEGAEYAVLDSIVKDGIRPRILCVEFHPDPDSQDGDSVRRTYGTITLLMKAGYQVTFRDAWNLTFVDSRHL